MIENRTPSLAEIEQAVCDITSEKLAIRRDRVLPTSRMVEDLHFDSLDLFTLLMEIEDVFEITLPTLSSEAPSPEYQAVFARRPLCLSDLAELAQLQQGTGSPDRKARRRV